MTIRHTSVPRPFRPRLTLFSLAMVVLGWRPLTAGEALGELLPPGHFHAEYQKLLSVAQPRPGPPVNGCRGCGDRRQGGLVFGEKGLLYQQVRLDPTVERWTGTLLRVEIGFPRPWSPEHLHVFFPGGIKGFGSEPMAVIGRDLVRFDVGRDEAGELRASTHPSYRLHWPGEPVVIGMRGGRQWEWESQGSGAARHLSSLYYAKLPSLRTRLEYEHGKITAVVLPDNGRVRLWYADDLVASILFPNGDYTRLTRDELGYITELETWHLDRRGRLGRDGAVDLRGLGSFRHFVWDRDPEGRISRTIDAGGNEFVVERASAADRDGVRVETVIVRNLADGSFRFRRYSIGAEWRVQEGVGEKGQAPDAAVVVKEFVQRKINHRHRTVRLKELGRPAQSMRYDDAGRCTARIDAFGRETEIAYDAFGNIDKSGERRNRDGQVTVRYHGRGRRTEYVYDAATRLCVKRHPDGGVTEYRYRPGGALTAIIDRGAPHVFKTDAFGRLIEHRRPDGSRTTWRYARYGPMISRTEYPAAGEANAVAQPATTEWRYDVVGRLTRVKYADGGEARYHYDCCRLVALKERCGAAAEFAYDARGRLVKSKRSRGDFSSSSRYVYDAGDRVIEKWEREGGPWRLGRRCEFDPASGRLMREALFSGVNGRRVIHYDRLGRRERIVRADGTTIRFSYTGTRRQPSEVDDGRRRVRLSYDGSGQLTRESLAELYR